jgi:hypothetical protein
VSPVKYELGFYIPEGGILQLFLWSSIHGPLNPHPNTPSWRSDKFVYHSKHYRLPVSLFGNDSNKSKFDSGRR